MLSRKGKKVNSIIRRIKGNINENKEKERNK